MQQAATTALALAALLAACTTDEPTRASGTPARASDPPPVRTAAERAAERAAREPVPYVPATWTTRFEGPAVLLADRIRIEGPPGLLEHLALRSEDALYERSVRTTEEGFLQTVRPRPGEGVREAARGQLDAWQLAATSEIVALERPGGTRIVVVAEGDAVWRDPDGHEERGARIRFDADLSDEDAPR